MDVKNGSSILYRTDFFPGLGWMMTKELWDELGPKWPRSYWDDWVRAPEQRANRACIRPEVSRTRTFGKKGVSKYVKLWWLFACVLKGRKSRSIRTKDNITGCLFEILVD